MIQVVKEKLYFDESKGVYLSLDESVYFKVGDGKSSSVFRIGKEDKVIKLFFPEAKDTAESEIKVYQKLSGLGGCFPTLYGYGDNYIVIDYLNGRTIYSYLTDGIHIHEKFIHQVDAALELAKSHGFNPVDVHLKNIIIVDDQVKIIDLARFLQDNHCNKWIDLKKAYYRFYASPFFPKKIPHDIMVTIAKLYKKGSLKGIFALDT